VVLYILLSGVPPFHSRSNRDILEKSAKGQYSLEGDEWDSISSDAKDLISKMLTFDPSCRITADEILQHPWIKMVVTDTNGTPLLSTTSAGVSSMEASSLQARKLTATPLNNALKNLTGHVKNRRMEKMATNLTKLMSSLQVGGKTDGKGEKGPSIGTLLQRLTAGVSTSTDKKGDDTTTTTMNDDDDGDSLEQSIQSMMSNDTKEGIIQMFQSSGTAGDGKLSVEQFYQIFQGVANGGEGSNPLMMVLMGRFLDSNKDGYITIEDLFLAEAKILQRSSDFVKTIFRAFSESIWYPGQKMNHMQMARSLGVFSSSRDSGSNSNSGSGDATHRESSEGTAILSGESGSSVADVFEPPKYITGKVVTVVFV
jgi:serine/threonine protein kinase